MLEYADGCDLRSKMATMSNDIPEMLALNWFTHACLGLAQMHSLGLVHRDIKPENILIVGENAGGIAKLGDFGTVRNVNLASHLTYKVGTPLYFAPEKKLSQYSWEVDVWSMGILLYEMLSGGEHPIDYDFEKGNLDEYMELLPSLKLKPMPDRISKPCQ